MKNITRIVLSIAVLMNGHLVQAFAAGAFSLFEEEAKVVIAAQYEQTTEEAPSIVSVIKREDIERYGARDLADILRLVPGFEFGLDVYSEAGLTFRGIFVEEGKSLLMIDGITQNELGFGNYSFFGTIPASMIEKVEIIRGPGSAIYGGFAEVDVINVITHRAENLNGMRVAGGGGAVGKGGSSRHVNVSYGNKTEAVAVTAHVGYGEKPLSTREYADYFGNKIKLNNRNAYRRWQHVITEAATRDLTVRYQRNALTMGAQDTFFQIQPKVNGLYLEQTNNYNDVAYADYKARLSDRLVLQPSFEYTRNNTWNFNFPASIDGYLEGSGATIWRTRGEMAAIYEAPWNAQIRVGGGVVRDDVENVASDGTPGLQLSSDPADLASRTHTSSHYGLFQYAQKFEDLGMTLGGRYEDSSFGSAFAPRAGLTYVRGAANMKLLYGRAFRIPLPWQAFSRVLAFNGDLDPEIAETKELELGYKFTPHVVGKVNTFQIRIKKPIVYQGITNAYSNFGSLESRGVEAELRANYARWGGFGNASYAIPGSDTSPGFTTSSSKNLFLAIPPFKANLGAYCNVGMLQFAPYVTYLSRRAVQSRASANDVNGLLETTRQPSLFLTNLNIMAPNVAKDLDVHLSVHNMFNQQYELAQPFYGGHAPIPAQDRGIHLGLTWHIR